MSLPIYVVDAFTIDGKPFTGNPAAVCFLKYDDDISDELKQQIALEMNLSETAFVASGWTAGNTLSEDLITKVVRKTLRWFTPTNEVPLCGHATVASAWALHKLEFPDDTTDLTIEFESKFSGKLGAVVTVGDGLVTLNFPANPPERMEIAKHAWIGEMIGYVLGSTTDPGAIADIQYSPKTLILMLRLKDEYGAAGLATLKPAFQAMKELDTGSVVRDCIVTVKGRGETGKPDFYSRFFAPWDGIDEDPVTGLAHTMLTPYWTKEFGTNRQLHARQHSSRGGDLYCSLDGDKVKLAGEARLGLKGIIFI